MLQCCAGVASWRKQDTEGGCGRPVGGCTMLLGQKRRGYPIIQDTSKPGEGTCAKMGQGLQHNSSLKCSFGSSSVLSDHQHVPFSRSRHKLSCMCTLYVGYRDDAWHELEAERQDILRSRQ